MARIRTVKPELLRHEDLYELELSSSLPIRLAFIGLFTVCDREGRFKWKPRQLKLDVLPYDEVDFSRVLDTLNTSGFVVKYEYEGEIYGCIPTFPKHQVINNKERASELPSFDISNIVTREPRVINASSSPLLKDKGEGNKEQGTRKGREGNSNVASIDGDDSQKYTFEDFYLNYPVKKSKQLAIKHWKKLSSDEKALAVELTGQFVSGVAQGINLPHPSTYLSDKRWEDEPDIGSRPVTPQGEIDRTKQLGSFLDDDDDVINGKLDEELPDE